MSDETRVRLVGLRATGDSGSDYELEFRVGERTYAISIEASEDTIAFDAEGEVEDGMEQFGRLVDGEELTEAELRGAAIGAAADFFASSLAEVSLLQPPTAEEMLKFLDEDGEV